MSALGIKPKHANMIHDTFKAIFSLLDETMSYVLTDHHQLQLGHTITYNTAWTVWMELQLIVKMCVWVSM